MIGSVLDIGVINAQFIALVLIIVIHEGAIFREWWRIRFEQAILSVSVEPPALSFISQATRFVLVIKAKNILLNVKEGTESLPTKNEILCSPTIRTNYSMLLDSYAEPK